MTALTKAALKALWIAKFQPTSANFADMFDSWTNYSASLSALGTAWDAGGTGLVESTGAGAVRFAQVATFAKVFLSGASTTAAAVSKLGAGTFGAVMFTAATTAVATAALGAGAVGLQIFAAATTAQVESLIPSAVSTPAGVISMFAGSAAPSGYLLCDGTASGNRTTHAALFAVIGTLYGAGDASTTFNVPDLRGRVGVGLDDMGGAAASRVTNAVSGIVGTTLGAAGGSQSHTLLTTEIPAHAHAVYNWVTGGGLALVGAAREPDRTAASLTEDSANTGGGGAHRNMQPSMMLNYIIKT